MRQTGWLSNRIALVTGAARGIGRATAQALMAEGASVAACDFDEGALASMVQQCASRGTVSPFALDVTRPSDFRDVAARIEQEMGPVDILVNNAGIMPIGAFLDHTPDLDRRQIDVNLCGVIHGMRAVLPRMVARGEGHVVNIVSVAGRIGAPHAAVYSATKFAVICLTESVRAEHRDSGVHFSYVMPALVDTELITGVTRPAFPAPLTPDAVAERVMHALRTRQVDVYAPRFARLSIVLPALLPRFVYERVGQLFAIDRLFVDVDDEARASYRGRIRGMSSRILR